LSIGATRPEHYSESQLYLYGLFVNE